MNSILRSIGGGLAVATIIGAGMLGIVGPVLSIANAAAPTTRQSPEPNNPGQRNAPPQDDRPRPAPRGIERAVSQLDLTDAQKPAVDAILKAYREKEQQAREELSADLKKALTPEQYEKFESGMTRPPPRDGNRQGPGEPSDQPRNRPAAAVAAAPKPPVVNADGSSEVEVTFTGGYETDPRDGGRPVVLIAAALNVPSDVFREAFSHVKPAGPGETPQDPQVRLNKQALMKALSPLGVTNERLDEVSNFYRYSSSRGQMWKNTPAAATATIRNGVVTGFTITNAGAGYSSAPTVSIPGMPDVKAEVKLSYGTDFKTNGSIREITIPTGKWPEHGTLTERGKRRG